MTTTTLSQTVSIQHKELVDTFSQVISIVPSKGVKDILECVKVEVSNSTFSVTATDLEVAIRSHAQVENSTSNFSFVVHAKTLWQIIKNCESESVEFRTGDEMVQIRCGFGRFELPTRPVEEFPDTTAFDGDGHIHEVAAGVLRTLIRRTAFAADRKEIAGRFALNGVLWEAEGKAIRLVATDTKRLAVCEGPVKVEMPGSRLIPAKTIALLERNLPDNDDELVRITMRANETCFQTDRMAIHTSLVEGKFPPHDKIIEQARKSATVRIPLPVEGFLTAVRQAAVVTDEESKRVDLKFQAGRVTLKARGAETGSSEVELALPDYDGPAVSVAFNPAYLIEYLRALEGEPTVTLELADKEKPVLFRCGESYTYVVMPLAG